MRLLRAMPLVFLAASSAAWLAPAEPAKEKDKAPAGPVSYYRDVRPHLPAALPGLPPAGQGRRAATS